MKGFMTTCVAALCATSGLAVVAGCDRYRNLVDPCYPERYEYAARNEVIAAFTPQVHNGHFLDQTVWNYQFEPGTDRLTPGGMDHLMYLARRRPGRASLVPASRQTAPGRAEEAAAGAGAAGAVVVGAAAQGSVRAVAGAAAARHSPGPTRR